ncbi:MULTISPECIES: LexA family transcriptional regulator [unclassified Oceanobacillus]|uniref:LexA family protein n=1 Tax=unclassified Oceanobacillus TaxID=2630292 RepID=UPI001BE64D35|nr:MULTISPECIES: LexA family transcriptional regulator [unclassified Oceanobacillus]MBT2601246.1 hypothetical protein [Oceanobacillus sp. ISL-74]MBT2653648.1 hypothetical protein [Oceanobacillus sp. ISL-73]
MKYSNILKEYIQKSGLRLDDISRKLEGKGLTASREYLSRLQNGKTKPASTELNKALSEITGGDSEKLTLAAYLEKAPRELKDFYSHLISKGQVTPTTIEERILSNEETYNNVRNELVKQHPEKREELLNKTSTPKKLIEFIDERIPNSDDFLRNRKDDNFIYVLLNHLIDTTKDHYKDFEVMKVENLVRVPILGKISAGDPIVAIENLEGYTTLPNPGNYNENDLFLLNVRGDSMIGSRIHEGDKVLVKLQPEVESGEIAVVNINNEEATLKRVKKLDSGETLLLPSNDKYEPILINDNNARIIGKVIQVIFEP